MDTAIELVLNDIIVDLEWVPNPKMICVPTRRREIMKGCMGGNMGSEMELASCCRPKDTKDCWEPLKQEKSEELTQRKWTQLIFRIMDSRIMK